MSDDTSDIVKRVTKGWAEGSPDVLLGIACKEIEELRQQRDEAIKERDEAQREVCEMIARTRRKAGIRGSTVGLDRVAPEAIAAERGWDCFAKEGGGA